MFTLVCGGGWVPGTYAEKIFGAAAQGFTAVEPLCWVKEDLDAAAAAIRSTGCVISAILIQSKDPAVQKLIENGHGIVHEDAKEAFVSAMKETVAAAKIIGCKLIVVTSGNERLDVPRGVQHQNIVDALKEIVPVAEKEGVTVVLEPLNVLVNHKGYYLTATAEGVEIIKEVGSENVRLLYDVYHQQITEGNLIQTIRENIAYIGHIHVGDVPGRNEPGTGEIHYKNVFKAIADTGYDGFVVFECGLTEPLETAYPKLLALLP
jgi:hydroxypyruvate isomerase